MGWLKNHWNDAKKKDGALDCGSPSKQTDMQTDRFFERTKTIATVVCHHLVIRKTTDAMVQSHI